MGRRGEHRTVVSEQIRRRTLNLESLEDRRLLAFEPAAAVAPHVPTVELPYASAPIADPFIRHAVTVEDMIARAGIYPYRTNELVVAYEVPAGETSSVDWSDRLGLAEVESIGTLMTLHRPVGTSVSLVHLDLGPGSDVLAAMGQLVDDVDVLWSSPNFYQTTDPREFIPNDPQYASQYHHTRMQNNAAWDVTLGDPSIIIGITDDGFDLDHVDLQANIWTNAGEIAGNSIDDDMNGYVDDVNGWDFITGNNNPNPNSSSNDHGTHVAGISAARTNNGVGVAGTAGHATIMPLQFYDLTLGWNAAEINAAFTYGADNGAKIVTTSYNIDSWVGDPVFTAGLQYSYDQGVLHFNSAGNGSSLNPTRQSFEQTLLVVSTESNDAKSSFSNYGTGVDISAPGGSIRSTLLNDNYGLKSGTSMASPNAAGVAALIWSANPTWTREQVAAQLLATADNIDAQNPSFAGLLGAGRANSFRGVTETIGAPTITELVGVPANGASFPELNLSEFSVRFSQIMDPASVNSLSSFELRKAGPDGLFDTGDDQLLPMNLPQSYQVSTNEFAVQVPGGNLELGEYRLSLVAGGLQNPFGTPLDGNGDGTAGDSFQTFFRIAPSPPMALHPLGSLVYQQELAGSIGSTGESDGYSIELDADQTLTVDVLGAGGLDPGLRVTDPNGAVLFDNTTTDATAQLLPVVVAGEYQIEVSGLNNSTGTYEVRVILNAAVEEEAPDGTSNDTPATAEDLTGSSLALGTSGATRMAVVGQLPPRTGLPVEGDDFESGMLDGDWTTFSSDPQGRIQITGSQGTAGGSFAMLMDRTPSGADTLNEAVWSVDLSSYSSPFLSFYHAEWGDEERALPLTFTGSVNGDGVSISEDGVTWHRVFNPISQPLGQWQQVEVDLALAATNAGISLGSNFRVKFQQFDNFPLQTDGRGYDEIVISVPTGNEDWYFFELDDAETATIGFSQVSGSGSQLELYAADGTTLLASGVTANNLDQVISQYMDGTTDGSPDTYYVRVVGTESPYSLVVTRNADFDTESNNLGSSQDLTGMGGVLGYVDSQFPGEGEDTYAVDLVSGQALNIVASLPGDGPFQFENLLATPSGSALELELRDPADPSWLLAPPACPTLPRRTEPT